MSFIVTQWYVGSNIHQKAICVYKYLSVEYIFLTLPTTLVFDGADGQVTDNKKNNNNNGRATLKQHW